MQCTIFETICEDGPKGQILFTQLSSAFLLQNGSLKTAIIFVLFSWHEDPLFELLKATLKYL